VIGVGEFFETPHDNAPNWVFMLTAYLDECGHEKPGIVTLGGFLGNKERWDVFAPRWREALGKRSSLHMHGLRWKKDCTKRLLERLGPIPFECDLIPIITAVNVADYYDDVAGRKIEKLLKGYYVALMLALIALDKAVPDESIKVVLDAQTAYEPMAKFILKSTEGWKTSSGEKKIISIEYVARGVTHLTEPADYLCYALHQKFQYPGTLKARLTSPILENHEVAVGHVIARSSVRQIVRRAAKNHPELSKTLESI